MERWKTEYGEQVLNYLPVRKRVKGYILEPGKSTV